MVRNTIVFICACIIGGCAVLFYFFHKSPALGKSSATYSIAKAPKETLLADIISFSGNVQWESRTATEPAKLTTLRSLQQGESIITGNNGSAVLSFDQHVTFSLSAKTTVNLIQTLPKNIVVAQDTGIVVYTKKDANPFSVRSSDLLVTILSGTTDVHVNEVDKTIVVTVHSGKVTAAYTDLENNTQTISLSAGQQLVYNPNQQDASIN